MQLISGYEAYETLARSPEVILYRGFRTGDRKAVLIKILSAAYPTPEQLARFRWEYRVGAEVASNHILSYLGLERYENGLALILEDIGGVPLEQLVSQGGLGVELFVTVATEVTNAIADLHSHGVIHRELEPGNIFVNTKTGEVRVTNLAGAARISQHNATPPTPHSSIEVTPYIAPEQTGRMAHAIDYRTDYYALGATFYTMLSGRPPFVAADPLELIHCHIARQPTPLRALIPDIPEPLAAIVGKLLAKNPEDRYQSAAGLGRDLEACRERLRSTGSLHDVRLGRDDIPEWLQIPQALYGRRHELATLASALERAHAGAAQLVLVHGRAGVGKSALVSELRQATAERHCYFISSTLAPAQRARPYGMWIAALQDLLGQAASQGSEQVAARGNKLRTLLGENGRLLMGLVPELAWLIGEQKPLAGVDVSKVRARVHKAFHDVIVAFAHDEPPLVIFLDDLHEVDSSSLELLLSLLTESRDVPLLIIGAYRTGALDADAPLTSALRTLAESVDTTTSMALMPLDQGQVHQLIADTLRVTVEEVAELGAVVHAKTGGNPLFVRELLRAAYEAGALKLDRRRARWAWDTGAIRDIGVQSDLGELLALRLDRLGPRASTLLPICACMGHRFDLDVIVQVSGMSRADTAELLEEAVQQDLIAPLGDAHKYVVELGAGRRASTRSDLPGAVSYRFTHERIQQAAYALLAEPDRARHHLAIGLALLDAACEAELDAALFAIADHLHHALPLIAEDAGDRLGERRRQCIDVELMAAKKAMGTGAFESALSYLNAALELVRGCSGDDPDLDELRIELCLRRAECEYLRSHYQTAEQQLLALLDELGRTHHALRVHILLVRLQIATANPEQALRYGWQGAALSGEELHLGQDVAATVHRELPALMVELDRFGRDELLHMAAIDDPDKALLIELYYYMCMAALHTDKLLSTLLSLRMIRLSLEWGSSPFLPIAYVVVAQHALLTEEDYDTARLYSDMAYALSRTSDDQSIKNTTYASLALSMLYWQQPIAASAQLLQECSDSAIAVGDINLGTGLFTYAIGLDLFRGTPLDAVERKARGFLDLVRRTGNMGGSLLTRYRAVRALRGGTASGTCLDGDGFTESEITALVEGRGNRLLQVNFNIVKLQLCCVFGDYAQACERAALLHQELPLVANSFIYPDLCFYSGLAVAALYDPDAPAPEHTLEGSLRKLRTWAELCPDNFRARCLLLEAEDARIRGDVVAAMDHYDDAIDAALEQGFSHIAAMAAERAGRFYQQRGRRRMARTYFDQADYSFARWGAEAKVAALRSEPGELVRAPAPVAASGPPALSGQLDASTILKATQAIAREIVLDSVLRKLVHTVMEHAGARRTVLVLDRDGELRIEAEGTLDPEHIDVLQAAPLEAHQAVPVALIRFVARSQRDVLIQDALLSAEFRDDPYMRSGRARSILCVPIQHQGKLTGALYVENDLTAGAFTSDRLEVLRSIASQATISIENARLYAELERSMERVASLERERLMTKLSRFQAVVETSSDLIGLCSLSGEILYVNPAGMALLERLGESLDDTHLVELFPWPMRERITGELLPAVRDKGHWLGELTLMRHSRDPVPVSVALTLVRNQTQEPIGVGMIARDISDSKRAEAELHKAKEVAEQANRAKSEFLANMSHELRTPMNAIIGLTELLLDTELTAEQQQFIETIHTSGDALLVLINDILDLSKIEAGQLKLEHQPFAVRGHLESALEIHGATAARKGLELVAVIGDEVPEAVFGDSGRLRQVLGNLLGNAVKFTDAGHVVLRADGRADDAGSCVLHLVVEDTGIGIAADKIERLFRPFSQVDSSMSRKYGGTGLGLAISKRLVEGMGGRIWVDSEPGRGSRFHVELPVLVAPWTVSPFREPDQPLLRKKRALVVADPGLGREVLLGQLRAWGMEPLVPDPAAAAAVARERGAHVAVVDLQTEGCDLRGLLEDLHDRGLPAITMAALQPQGFEAASRLSDMLLLKPIKMAQLHDALSRSLATAAADGAAPSALTSQAAQPHTPLGVRMPLRILLAEDNPINLKVALAMLERLGYWADVAKNGVEVLDALEQQRYDVVLMDVQMPEMDGVEAARQILKRMPEAARPRIIALTAHAMAGDREYLLAAGMDDYLSKPIRMTELVEALQRMDS